MSWDFLGNLGVVGIYMYIKTGHSIVCDGHDQDQASKQNSETSVLIATLDLEEVPSTLTFSQMSWTEAKLQSRRM